MSDEFDRGWRAGYAAGDMERIALATANSDLRSEVRELRSLAGIAEDVES